LIFSAAAISLHVALRNALAAPRLSWLIPLWATLAVGGLPLVWDLTRKAARQDFGSDLLAGISIVTACLLSEYLVACIVILMLSGGGALDEAATRRASSVLQALAPVIDLSSSLTRSVPLMESLSKDTARWMSRT